VPTVDTQARSKYQVTHFMHSLSFTIYIYIYIYIYMRIIACEDLTHEMQLQNIPPPSILVIAPDEG